MIKEKIENLIKESLKNLGIETEDIVLEHPADNTHGDYSTNVAMKYFGPTSKVNNTKKFGIFTVHRSLNETKKFNNPRELAEKIKIELDKNLPKEISKIEVAGAGFINFYLSSNYYFNRIKQILELGENYGKLDLNNGKKILIEHSSPNLFKPFHIGHVMNNAIGESINRLARFSGANVTTISYPSDVSLGIGKAIWMFLEDGIEKINEFKTEKEKLDYLGGCYVRGTQALEADPNLESRIREITRIIFDQKESKELEAYNIGKKINLSYFKNITERLGSKFDAFIYESEAGREGEKIVREHIGDIFEKSDGAVIYKGEQDGLHTRVFINKEGYPTYEAKDVGLLSLKFSRYNPDLSIFITDYEQAEYFKVVMAAAGKINKIWKEKTIHRTHGRMSFKGQKMSSRLGGVPLATDIIETIFAEIYDHIKDRIVINPGEDLEAIAIGALKFTILRTQAGRNINFDPETSLSLEGDSGPYLQYSIVRANSILEKVNFSLLEISETKEITDIEKYLDRFEEVVQNCITLWEPHHLVGYLLELSQAFSSWYGRVKIIDSENKDMAYNLAIVKSFYQTMKNGLWLLGIETPEKM